MSSRRIARLHVESLEARMLLSSAAGLPGLSSPPANSAAQMAANAVPLATQSLSDMLNADLAFASTQLKQTMNDLGNVTNKYVDRTDSTGHWKVVTADTWTAGYLPGAFWQMYQATGDSSWATAAKSWTLPLSGVATSANGDLAVRLMTTFLPLYEQTGDPAYRQVLLDAAASKETTWNETIGAFETTWRQSNSGNPQANFGVLMDQTVDMQLMIWAAQQTNNQTYLTQVTRHVRNVIAHLIRPDGSTYQWGYFDTATGNFIDGETYQGYSNDSTWSRGQAWAIYSLTAVARQLGLPDVLAAAEKVADYFIAHLPSDSIPYWDFNDPDIPNTYRDTSAAAIAASGMLDLSTLVSDPATAQKYQQAAENILTSLSSSSYLAKGSTSHGILLHGAENVPNDKYGDNVSLIFGDYYFLEAINRYNAIISPPKQTGTLSGFCFGDTNMNGVFDSGELKAAGKTVFLDTNNNGILDSGEKSMVTDANGNFSFTNLAPGTYHVRRVFPTGYTYSTAPIDITLSAGQTVTNLAIGSERTPTQTGTLSGFCFSDTNGNGVFDSGEAKNSGKTVFLDTNNNGILDSGEQSMVTDANGNFSFTNLPPGTYHVRRVFPTGYTYSNTPIDVTLSAGQTVTNLAIGSVRTTQQTGTLSGYCFGDNNSNGVFDTGDVKASGKTVFLDTNNNGKLDSGEKSMVTDANGNFSFTNLAPGTYHVRRVFPTGYTSSTPLIDITLGAGQTITNLAIGSERTPQQTGTLSGFCFGDNNSNGVFDSGDVKASGKTVFLDTNNNGKLDSGEKSIVTDANGNFSFTNLAPGTYHVRRVFPAGYTYSTKLTDVVLAAGQTISGIAIGSKRSP